MKVTHSPTCRAVVGDLPPRLPHSECDTAKRFEADVAPVFGACEKTQQKARLRLTETRCKFCATEIKE